MLVKTFFTALTLICFECGAGSWKQSLDFELDGFSFNHSTLLHQGLSDYERHVSENATPPSRIKDEDIGYDYDMGNAIFRDPKFYSDPYSYKSPTNTTNVALASLEVIMKIDATHYDNRCVHILNTSAANSRLFLSSDPWNFDVKNYFKRKIGKIPPSIVEPPSLKDHWRHYHPYPHSEDGILYDLGGNDQWKGYIDSAINKSLTGPIVGVVLHIHTRFDMCGTCAYSLSWEFNSPLGFGEKIFRHCALKNRTFKAAPPPAFTALNSVVTR
jgi:hypothetical protein